MERSSCVTAFVDGRNKIQIRSRACFVFGEELNLSCLLNPRHFSQVGGNKRAKEFLKSQPDYDHYAPLQQKYNTKAAALYRDKVSYHFLRDSYTHLC